MAKRWKGEKRNLVVCGPKFPVVYFLAFLLGIVMWQPFGAAHIKQTAFYKKQYIQCTRIFLIVY